MSIIFDINKKIINIIDISEYKIIYINVSIEYIINYIKYLYNSTSACCKQIYYDRRDYKYIKFFDLILESGINIKKDTICKIIVYNYIYKKYNTFYSYFIYNKYYTCTSIEKIYQEYQDIDSSINSFKLFNCRDYYKILSFIIDL